MKLIRENIGMEIRGKKKYRTSLFFCPGCEKNVERRTAYGKTSKACSAECGAKLSRNTYQNNPCPDCAVDNCEWLLKGKRVKGWKAVKIPYPGSTKFSETYKIAFCPKFIKA